MTPTLKARVSLGLGRSHKELWLNQGTCVTVNPILKDIQPFRSLGPTQTWMTSIRTRPLCQRLENEYRLRFVRMLGWGGMGAVALFDTRFKQNPAQDDTTYSFFAIKFPLRRGNKEDRDFRREKKYMAVSLLPSFPTFARESGASTDAQCRCLPRDTNGPFTSPRSSNGPPTGPGPERLRSSTSSPTNSCRTTRQLGQSRGSGGPGESRARIPSQNRMPFHTKRTRIPPKTQHTRFSAS